MKRLNLTFGLLCLGGTMLLPLQAQNTTNLPTSMYGIGELSPGDGGRLSGMGNVGIALNRLGFQNTLNPAAITRMDSTCFQHHHMLSGSSGYSDRYVRGCRYRGGWILAEDEIYRAALPYSYTFHATYDHAYQFFQELHGDCGSYRWRTWNIE